MRSGRDARRRNRNIGTAKQGHGRDNRLVIPSRWSDDRVFYEIVRSPVRIVRHVNRCRIRFLVEPTTTGFIHTCTPDDICHVLTHVPREHWEQIKLIILRQPTRKQNQLNPVWGRLVYWARVGRDSGPAIYLESQDPTEPMRWPRSLNRESFVELDRLREEGHEVVRERRHFVVNRTPAAIRAKQLYRTLLHEIGHEVDYLRSCVWPFAEQEDGDLVEEAERAYRVRPVAERESYADQYSDEHYARLKGEGVIPFDPLGTADALRADGLDPDWFLTRP